MDKVNLLKSLYFDPSGYQSKHNLYKEAKKKDPTITIKFVNERYDTFNEKLDTMEVIVSWLLMQIMNIKSIYFYNRFREAKV